MATKQMRSSKYGLMLNGSLWENCIKCGKKYYYCYLENHICENGRGEIK